MKNTETAQGAQHNEIYTIKDFYNDTGLEYNDIIEIYQIGMADITEEKAVSNIKSKISQEKYDSLDFTDKKLTHGAAIAINILESVFDNNDDYFYFYLGDYEIDIENSDDMELYVYMHKDSYIDMIPEIIEYYLSKDIEYSNEIYEVLYDYLDSYFCEIHHKNGKNNLFFGYTKSEFKGYVDTYDTHTGSYRYFPINIDNIRKHGFTDYYNEYIKQYKAFKYNEKLTIDDVKDMANHEYEYDYDEEYDYGCDSYNRLLNCEYTPEALYWVYNDLKSLVKKSENESEMWSIDYRFIELFKIVSKKYDEMSKSKYRGSLAALDYAL